MWVHRELIAQKSNRFQTFDEIDFVHGFERLVGGMPKESVGHLIVLGWLYDVDVRRPLFDNSAIWSYFVECVEVHAFATWLGLSDLARNVEIAVNRVLREQAITRAGLRNWLPEFIVEYVARFHQG